MHVSMVVVVLLQEYTIFFFFENAMYFKARIEKPKNFHEKKEIETSRDQEAQGNEKVTRSREEAGALA
jgi:hypothetical protein